MYSQELGGKILQCSIKAFTVELLVFLLYFCMYFLNHKVHTWMQVQRGNCIFGWESCVCVCVCGGGGGGGSCFILALHTDTRSRSIGK